MLRSLVLLAAAGCGGSAGKLVNEQKDPAAFVTEKQPLVLIPATGGLVRMNLDGSSRETLAAPGYGLEAMTRDGRMLALGDKDTNLFVLDAAAPDRTPRQVHALDGRAGSVAMRPDGGLIAVTRHADFSQPQARWGESEDDAVYLIDPRTLAVDVIPKTRDELVTGLVWTADGSALVLGMFHHDQVRLDLATRTRTVTHDEPPIVRGAGTRTCERTGDRLERRGGQGDEGVDIVSRTGQVRRLIVIEGRKRGFHDHLGTIEEPVFTPSCRYVVFGFRRTVWVADAATGVVGKLAEGGDPRLLNVDATAAPDRL